MNHQRKEGANRASKQVARPMVSALFSDGSIVETLYRPDEQRTLFCIFNNGEIRYETHLADQSTRLVPYSPNNNLLRNEVVLLPSEPSEYGSEEQLVGEVEAFVHRYVDVSPLFAKIASYYVLLSWVYDSFNELPYLRLRGDPGSGKTRFLQTVGALCYKPIFASGASTVSPLFRILDAFRGTLIIDEGDFRLSDEKAEIVKILNNGNAKGFPVLRSEPTGKGEFNPRAYHVFGPKLVATRGFFEDRALESRCLTEEMGQFRLREDIPINLPADYKTQALQLRNRLLLFRFRNLHKQVALEALVDRSIEPRLNQIFVPLLSIIEDAKVQQDLRELARRYNSELISDRGMDMEAQLLEIIRDMLAANPEANLSIKDITSWFIDRHGEDYERKITTKWIGSVIRRKLQLKAHKSNGVYVISLVKEEKLNRLFEKYGLTEESEVQSETETATD
jgi:hypothetical protein